MSVFFSSMAACEHQARVDAAAPPMPKQPRPIVVIGAGGIVRAAHLPAYKKAAFPVLAVVDVDAERAAVLARDFDIPYRFASVLDAVRFAPADAVFDVAVPALHLLSVLSQLPDRCVVLLQKPMGETLDQARAIRDLCRRRNMTAAANFQLRYAPVHLGALALASQGVLGDVHDIEVRVRTYTPWHQWTFLSSAPRLEILYHSIHYLDLVRAWLGEPFGIYAKTVRHPACAHLAPTKTTMILDYGDRARVSISTMHGHDLARSSQESYVQWEGTRGAIRMGMGVNLSYPAGEPDTLSFIERSSGQREWTHLKASGNWFPDAFMGSMGALQAFAEGSIAELPTGVESAFRTMALVEAAYRSSERGGEPVPE